MSEIELPSGRTIDPAFGIIGIDEQGEMFAGYDNHLCANENKYLTPEEIVFVADLMIARWQKARAAVAGVGGLSAVDLAKRLRAGVSIAKTERWNEQQWEAVLSEIDPHGNGLDMLLLVAERLDPAGATVDDTVTDGKSQMENAHSGGGSPAAVALEYIQRTGGKFPPKPEGMP